MDQDDRRRFARSQAKMPLVFRDTHGVMPDVALINLASAGCQVTTQKGHLVVGQYVIVRIGGLEGLPGVVRWAARQHAGIEFGRELHPSVLAHLLKDHSLEEKELDARLEFIDQFGRLLPELPLVKIPSRTEIIL